MRGGKLRFLRFGGRSVAFYFKLQTAEHLTIDGPVYSRIQQWPTGAI
jgi:hypothetical protein